MKRKLKTNKGFTLIEVLVAITIFMIFITSISSAYLDIAKSQREANAVRAVYSEIRYIFDLVGQEARSKTIDYGCPGSFKASSSENETGFAIKREESSPGCLQLNGVPKSDYLALVDSAGTERTVFLIDDDLDTESKKLFYLKEQKEPGSLEWISVEGFGGFTEIELKNIKINNFNFEIAPLVDPFDTENIGCGAIQFQPSVSMYASISSINDKAKSFNMDLQTTVSSRVYDHQTDF